MLEGILKGLMQWIYGLFLDLIAYCANALLGVMSTDLTFFETSVPIVPSLYQIFVAVGWGLLIGNMAFQSMKAMFAGLGIETESPFILMLRTFLFGTLLIFSKDICDIGLSIGKNVIDILGIPDSVTLTMPDETYFTGGASWLLVIIIGFILGFQLIKLFFEIAERYVIVAVLTLLMPVGLAMGGSKSTKDICAGYIRTYASMIVLMVTNVLFLKLILSALAAMPSGIMVLPWCLLVVGLAKTARKTDNLISRIGMNPAMTGDPLGRGRGLMMAAIAARTIISSAGKGGKMPAGNGKTSSGGKVPPNNTKGATAHTYNGNVHNTTGGTNVGGESAFGGNNQQTGYSSGGNSSSNANSSTSARFGSANYNSANQSGKGFSSTVVGGAGTGNKVNTNRFGIQKEKANTGAPIGTKAGASGQKNGTNQQIQKSKTEAKQGMDANRKNRFGSSANNGIKHNPNPMKQNGKVGANKLQNTKAPNGVKMQGPLNAKGVMPTNVRFGSEQRKVLRDDDILITKDEDDV